MESIHFATLLVQELLIASKKTFLSATKRKAMMKAALLAYHMNDLPESAKDPYSPQAASFFLKVRKWNHTTRSKQNVEYFNEVLNEIEIWQNMLYTPDNHQVVTKLRTNIRLIDPIKKSALPQETIEQLNKIFEESLKELNTQILDGKSDFKESALQSIIQLNEYLDEYNTVHFKLADTCLVQVALIVEKTKHTYAEVFSTTK